jgi:hypothetical protein
MYIRLSLFYQLPNCNLLPSMCYLSYGETPLVNCGPRYNFLYIALPFYYYSLCLLSCILLSFYHSIRSILCLQQTGEIDNLIVSWEQGSWLCCVQVSCCCWVKRHQQVFWRHCLECHEASKHHLLKFGFLLLVR